MKDIPLSHLLDTATRAAEAAGKHAFDNKHRRTETSETFNHDIKLVLDAESQRIAERTILSEFPSHGILGEEDASPSHTSAYEWIIDPIDGTMNFFHGFPYWCSSVAVRHHGKILAGCVFAPEFNDSYTAHTAAVAKRNGEPIHASETRRLEDAIMFTGLSKHMESDADRHFDMFRMLALNTQKVRITGSAALDLCHVAVGTCDGFFETSIYLWDHAAAGLIAERAGAVLSLHPLDHEPHATTVLCANAHLIDGLRTLWEKFDH